MGADQLRKRMVDRLRGRGRLQDDAVERAFRTVPRHLFLPDVDPVTAYHDEAIVTKWLDNVAISSASQPSMMAIMLEQLDLRPGHRVLEIGAGTGYNAALMAQLVGPTGSVTSMDIDADLVDGAARHLAEAGVTGVRLLTGDGALGHPAGAPYDRIMLTVGSWDIQPAWWSQLAPGGRLLLPLSVRGSQLSAAFDLVTGPTTYLRSSSVRGCAFVRLRGAGAMSESSRRLGPDGPVLAEATPDAQVLEHLGAWLTRPGSSVPTMVRLAGVDLWDGFGLWALSREPRMHRLLVDSADTARWPTLVAPRMDGGTLMLLGAGGCALVEPYQGTPDDLESRFPVAVRGFGPAGAGVAAELARLLREWVRAGQPSAATLRLLAYRTGEEPPVRAGAVLNKTHTTLVLDWPGHPMANGPTRAG